MMHPHTRLAVISDRIGFGVVATRPIPAGTIVWVRDPLDQRIPRAEARHLGPLYRDTLRHYAFWTGDDTDDLVLCWDHGRYVNHSCDANCLGGGFEFEVAVRDIAEGEQLTDDYATFGYAFEFQCSCGEPGCRGTVSRRDAQVMGPLWDHKLLHAMLNLHSVDQPLWPLVEDKAFVDQVIVHPEIMPLHRVA